MHKSTKLFDFEVFSLLVKSR